MIDNTTANYLSFLSNDLLLDIVRRAFNLDTTTGNVIVLCGPQGCGKSQFIQTLAFNGKVAILNANSIHGNETFETDCRLVEIVNFADLKWRNYSKLKQVLANPKNSKVTFIGTTTSIPNPNTIDVHEPFRPVQVGQIDIPMFRRDKDQMYAQAVAQLREFGELTQ